MEIVIHDPKPCEFIGKLAIYNLAIHDPKPYELIGKLAIYNPMNSQGNWPSMTPNPVNS